MPDGTSNFTDPGGMEGIGLPPAGPMKNPSTDLGLNLEPLSHETEALAIGYGDRSEASFG